ncbi:hypothetical protein IE53DRAFT_363506 [Violaceomyces palustris]|uniref:Uncharacterized protein n=1 Tax=Violaceomyces palustris TaxID=1673888 RepID=A0ACD0NT47_9BASI|nr:hypothetical protein IE53DRAFT_363506 [Violaceomyces palustris]
MNELIQAWGQQKASPSSSSTSSSGGLLNLSSLCPSKLRPLLNHVSASIDFIAFIIAFYIVDIVTFGKPPDLQPGRSATSGLKDPRPQSQHHYHPSQPWRPSLDGVGQPRGKREFPELKEEEEQEVEQEDLKALGHLRFSSHQEFRPSPAKSSTWSDLFSGHPNQGEDPRRKRVRMRSYSESDHTQLWSNPSLHRGGLARRLSSSSSSSSLPSSNLNPNRALGGLRAGEKRKIFKEQVSKALHYSGYIRFLILASVPILVLLTLEVMMAIVSPSRRPLPYLTRGIPWNTLSTTLRR